MRTMFMSAQFLLKIYNLFTALKLPMTNLSRVICNDLVLLKKNPSSKSAPFCQPFWPIYTMDWRTQLAIL